jgi:hypothetical protein
MAHYWWWVAICTVALGFLARWGWRTRRDGGSDSRQAALNGSVTELSASPSAGEDSQIPNDDQ